MKRKTSKGINVPIWFNCIVSVHKNVFEHTYSRLRNKWPYFVESVTWVQVQIKYYLSFNSVHLTSIHCVCDLYIITLIVFIGIHANLYVKIFHLGSVIGYTKWNCVSYCHRISIKQPVKTILVCYMLGMAISTNKHHNMCISCGQLH